jgi:Uma2 family endonuclease
MPQAILERAAIPAAMEREELVTAEEFFWQSFDNRRAELVQGEVIELSPASGEHGIVAMGVGIPLGVYVKQKKLGVVCAAETGFIIARNPDTVRAPVAAFISNERLEQNGGRPSRGFFPFAPDLAVEVVSPGDTAEGVEAKTHAWFEAGARLVWIVYPSSQTVHVFRSPTDVQILQRDDTLKGGEVVPGFECAVAEIFA